MYFFTADEHYGHSNIIRYCNRPFEDVHEMNKKLQQNHNGVVEENDIVIHVGDFAWTGSIKDAHKNYISKLKGNHIFLRGSHDRWLPKNSLSIWEKKIEEQYIVACHYAMRTWARSHYGSWQLYGHSHGNLPPLGLQWDVGVDNNNYYPISFKELQEKFKNVVGQ